MATILWTFMSQRGCYEPALPVVAGLMERGHTVIGLTQSSARVSLPWAIEVLSDHFLPPPPGFPMPAWPPGSLTEALAGKTVLAAWHKAEVQELIRARQVDHVLADGFRLGAGIAAEGLDRPWVAYTHHYFNEGGTSEGMVEYYCQRFGIPDSPGEVFEGWWPSLRESLGSAGDDLDGSDRCWWNLSPFATLVFGLPELKVHRRSAPPYAHRVGPCLWTPAQAHPEALSGLGADRPAILVSLSTNPLDDEILIHAAGNWVDDFDVVVTAGNRSLPDLPSGLAAAGDLAHGWFVERASVVVCSAGHGTVTRAACAGIGVVAVPRMGDQFLVADAVAATGLGVQVDASADLDQLTGALEAVLSSNPAPRLALEQAAANYSAVEDSLEVIEVVLARH